MRKSKLIGIVLLVIFTVSNSWVSKAQESYYGMEEVKVLKVNETKDIQRLGSCWSNAGAALLEAELFRNGRGEYDLAELDFIHNSYLEKAKVYLETDGKVRISEKGMAQDVILFMKEYGMVPEAAYMKSSKDAMDPNQGEMDGILKGVMANVVQVDNGEFTERWQSIYDAALTGYIGEARIEFTDNGNEYTPKSFAEKSGLNPEDYILLTSDNREEMNKSFILKKRDNWHSDKFNNLKIDQLSSVIDGEVKAGYTVLWYGALDQEMIFEDEQVAIVPAGAMPGSKKAAEGEEVEEEPVSERSVGEIDRQQVFEAGLDLDLDYLLIYGVSKDKNGNEYFIGKNVCQTNSAPIFLSKEYVKLNTIFMLTNKAGMSKDIKAGLGM